MNKPDTARRVSAQLDPETSAALFKAVDYLREAFVWTRALLAAKANTTDEVLDTWAYKVRRGETIRIDLDKALALLAAVGYADNAVDELWWQLSEAAAVLVGQAVTATTQKTES
jgi:hypothetical protein